MRLLLALVLILASAAAAAATPPLARLHLPPGFHISLSADHVPNARAGAVYRIVYDGK